MSNTQYQNQNWAKVSQMTQKLNNQFKQCTRSTTCNKKREHKKQILKNGLEWNLITKKILGNNSYTSRSTY